MVQTGGHSMPHSFSLFCSQPPSLLLACLMARPAMPGPPLLMAITEDLREFFDTWTLSVFTALEI